MIEKSTKYNGVAAVEKDVASTGKDVIVAEKEGRKC